MPLTKIQIAILRLLADHRDPESYVAGATPLNRDSLRYSKDIDIFHDREERVAAAALDDAKTLEAAGYRVTWLRQLPLIYAAEVFIARMPTDKMGLLFLKNGEVVQPDPDRLGDYQTHAGQRRGHWPTSPEITASMLEECQKTENQAKKTQSGD